MGKLAVLPAISIIKKYEGFSEKAIADPATGGAPYVIGFGTEYYPDGSPVLNGHRVSREKAKEYLVSELKIISQQLDQLNLDIDWAMKSALLSFIHSVGWDCFLYSDIIDAIENEDFDEVISTFYTWIFDVEHQAIGGLIERRAEEAELFLTNISEFQSRGSGILLKAFRDYEASKEQVDAIRSLESKISPYALSIFLNEFGTINNRLQVTSNALIEI